MQNKWESKCSAKDHDNQKRKWNWVWSWNFRINKKIMFTVYLGNSLTCRTKVNCIPQSIFPLFHSNCFPWCHQLLSWRFPSLPCSWLSQMTVLPKKSDWKWCATSITLASIFHILSPAFHGWEWNLTEPASIISPVHKFPRDNGAAEGNLCVSGEFL